MTEGFTSCATLIASVEQLRSRRLHQRSSRRHSRGVHRHHWRSQDGRQGRHPSSSRQLHLHLPPPHSYGPRSHGNDPSLRHRPSRRSRGSVSERSAEGGSKLSLGRRAPQGGTHEARRTGDEEGCQMGEGGERRRNFTFTASLLTPFRRWFDERPSRATSTSSPRLLPHRPSPSLLTFVFLSSSPLVTHASPSLAPLPMRSKGSSFSQSRPFSSIATLCTFLYPPAERNTPTQIHFDFLSLLLKPEKRDERPGVEHAHWVVERTDCGATTKQDRGGERGTIVGRCESEGAAPAPTMDTPS